MIIGKIIINVVSFLFTLLGFVSGYYGNSFGLFVFGTLAVLTSFLWALLIYVPIAMIDKINKIKSVDISFWSLMFGNIYPVIINYRMYRDYLLLGIFIWRAHYIILGIYTAYTLLKLVMLTYESILSEFTPTTVFDYIKDKWDNRNEKEATV